MFWIGKAIAFNLLKNFIRLKFPLVQRMTTEELAGKLKDSEQSDLIILDARSEAEYSVSHLEKARRIDALTSDSMATEALENVSRDTSIVIYCSVGYRSAKAAQQLLQAGFPHTFNLEGGIFQWANEGRLIVHHGQPTQLVHPYNPVWGVFLKKQNRLKDK